jgi:8-oxo-dGTP diphosphatase
MHDQGRARNEVTPRVLVFGERDGRVLLIEGGPTKWFAGRLNGLGGHVEPGEDAASAAARECEEECGLRPASLRLAAVVHVDAEPRVMLFVFSAALPPGDVRGSVEGRLRWLSRAELADPSLPLLPDVRTHLRLIDEALPGAPPALLTASW